MTLQHGDSIYTGNSATQSLPLPLANSRLVVFTCKINVLQCYMATTLHTEEAKRQNGIILKYFYGFYRWLAMISSTG